MQKIQISTCGEGFYDITRNIQDVVARAKQDSGFALLFCPHTSCALAISEAYDPLAKQDIENFLKELAPRNLPFIKHDSEGADDSPSHMKSVILHQSVTFMVEKKAVLLGRWQGIYLAEFRDQPHERELWLRLYGE